ncbi:hypothetical protein ACH6CV_16845 [Bacillota bacterium Meth-B3]
MEQALESVLSIIHAIWQHWTSPEFDHLRWILVGMVIAGPLGYLARIDAEEAAQEDEDRAWLAAAAAARDGDPDA